MNKPPQPPRPVGDAPTRPRWATYLLRWLVAPHRLDELESDLDELFQQRAEAVGTRRARWRYVRDVLSLLRPSLMKREEQTYPKPTHTTMIRNYLKIAFRTLIKNKGYSGINIGGLAVGMTVAMLIGLWVYDELSFNKSFQQYDRIAKVMQGATVNGVFGAGEAQPVPLADILRTDYASDFTHVLLSSWNNEHVLTYGDKRFTKRGRYISPEAPNVFTLPMMKGTRSGLKDPASILLAASVAEALFDDTDPIGKIVKIDNKLNVKVTGVYADLPYNTELHEMLFIAPWDLYVASEPWIQANAGWHNNSWQIFAQIAPNTTFKAVSEKIKNLRLVHVPETAHLKPVIFLHPMSRWHLYGWDHSGREEGRIQYIWLFGIVGIFVLLLACINFMNLSTARSEKRAKEVGIRKAIGSFRTQLIGQFFSESLLVVAIAFTLSLLLTWLALPFFNDVADKQLSLPWTTPVFWLLGLGFCLFTGLIAGSYPALYLSSFQPIKVLKGVGALSQFRFGRLASLPRQVLVVIQFTVSATLIIGTIIVFQQIQYAKNRPIGYDRAGLVTVTMNTPELSSHYNALRSELIEAGAISDMTTSSSPTTELGSRLVGFDWPGKDPTFKEQLGVMAVTHDFGKTVGWQFVAGRDFSRAFSTDSSSLILNETAVRYMGLTDPVGKTIKWNGKPFQIVGVIKDMVMESPFEPVYQTAFLLNYGWSNVITLKLNPRLSASESLARAEVVFRKFNPASPFDYKFSDLQYALKFAAEERIGTLASVFAVLAIFISCLGLFGLASFIAEQRTKEMGVRKVLGASALNVWSLLSKDFVVLVVIALGMAVPLAYYTLNQWLQRYTYRTDISWWIFAATDLGAILITLLTVSFQAIKTALMNPVRSLRSE
ncbi:ABC transporter permease [Fibrella sp. WM1]|uniref:ABC transporter permease n=1 Tax=Fibrella musci TaxID=3242485 RepID=UPI0035225827